MTAAKIRSLLARRGLSWRQLAEVCRVHPSTVAKWCSGAIEPSGPACVLLEQLASGNLAHLLPRKGSGNDAEKIG